MGKTSAEHAEGSWCPARQGVGGGAGTRRSVNKDGAGGPKQPGGLLSLLTTHVLSEDVGKAAATVKRARRPPKRQRSTAPSH